MQDLSTVRLNVDMNNYTTNGIGILDCREGSSVSNAPSGFNDMGILRVTKNNYGVLQEVFKDGDDTVYIRNKWGNDWRPWVRIDNFGCNTLAELKAALANV